MMLSGVVELVGRSFGRSLSDISYAQTKHQSVQRIDFDFSIALSDCSVTFSVVKLKKLVFGQRCKGVSHRGDKLVVKKGA